MGREAALMNPLEKSLILAVRRHIRPSYSILGRFSILT
jgi:hypothetical protein